MENGHAVMVDDAISVDRIEGVADPAVVHAMNKEIAELREKIKRLQAEANIPHAKLRGHVTKVDWKPTDGGLLGKITFEVPGIHRDQSAIELLAHVMAEGIGVHIGITPTVEQTELPMDGEAPANDGPVEGQTSFEDVADQPEDSQAQDDPARLLTTIDENWQGTGIPLYGLRGDFRVEDIANMANDCGLSQCVVHLTKTNARGIETSTLYHWNPEAKEARRVPQHSVRELVEQLGGTYEPESAPQDEEVPF